MHIWIKWLSLVLLTGTAIAVAQNEHVIPVAEVTGSDAPVRVTGRVITKDQPSEVAPYSFEGDIQMANVSGKPILLIIVTLKVLSSLPVSLDYREERDYFFESEILQPGSLARLQRVLGRFGKPSRDEDFAVQAKPSARAKVEFVQFSDGSSWGDPTEATKSLQNRRVSMNKLELLSQEYRKRSEEQFVSELLQPTLLQPLFSLQELYREKQNLAPVLAKLDDMLANARAHSERYGKGP